jgi:acyl-CoA synthetase (AMP-forming)/AMP-acid ligase II
VTLPERGRDEPRTIVEAVRRHAAERPDHPAYVFLDDGEAETGRLTFAETDLRARAIAAELQAQGAGGQRVLISYPACLDYVTAFLGCLYAGAVAVPCDGSTRRAGPERLALIAADARPSLVIGRAGDDRGVLAARRRPAPSTSPACRTARPPAGGSRPPIPRRSRCCSTPPGRPGHRAASWSATAT